MPAGAARSRAWSRLPPRGGQARRWRTRSRTPTRPARGVAAGAARPGGAGRPDPLVRRDAGARGRRGRACARSPTACAWTSRRWRRACSPAQQFQPTLTEEVPSGTMAFVGAAGLDGVLDQLERLSGEDGVRAARAHPAAAQRQLGQRGRARPAAGRAAAAGARGGAVRLAAGERPGGDARGGRYDRGGGRATCWWRCSR